MRSVTQEHLLAQVEQATRAVLEEAPTRLERSTGFLQREGGKVTGRNFVQTLVLGTLANASPSLEEWTQHAAAVGLEISDHGLEKRFTMRGVALLQAVFEEALTQVVLADPVAIPLLSRFGGGCVEDSSTIRLPETLSEVFRGCGGKGSRAACKLFVRLDLLSGQLCLAPIQDGKRADTNTPLKGLTAPVGTLHIRDRGFTDVGRWHEEEQAGQFTLTYLRAGVQVADEQGQVLDLVEWLPRAPESGERQVRIGQGKQLPMRLFFERVPEAVAQERRRRLRREAHKCGQALSPRVEFLAGWTLAVTTVPADLLSLQEALILLRLRWQIELLFRLWKEQGHVDEWRTKKPERILCEIYAKLIALLLQHWLLIVSCWHQPHRSLMKAAKAVRRYSVLISAALEGDLDLHVAFVRIGRVAQAGSCLNPRRDAPNTSHMLFSGQNTWSSKPKPKRRLK